MTDGPPAAGHHTWLERAIAAILAPRVDHRRVVAYLADQARLGRHLADAMEDPYVVNRLGEGERRALLEDAELIAAWHAAMGAAPAPAA